MSARRRAIGLILAACALSLAACTSAAGSGPPEEAAAPLASASGASPAVSARAAADSALPFDMPSTRTLRSSPHLVFAHYWPPLPVSLDNRPPASDYYAREYLTPGGEKGKHAAYGGYLRDRPLPRSPRTGSDWRLADMEGEVREAIAVGIDGFTLDILQLPGDRDIQVWNNAVLMMQAAAKVDPGFKIVLMPDMSGGLARKPVNEVASAIATLAGQPSAYHLGDGRLVLSPFQAESRDVGWWKDLFARLKSKFGIEVAFVPLFQDEQAHLDKFTPISWGMSHWGARNPQWNDPLGRYPSSRVKRVLNVRNRGLVWMQPVSVQDERPKSGLFDEAANTTNLRATWQIVRDSGAEWVQMTTWNDFGEGTQFEPSVKHGSVYLDISAYYLAWWKTGSPPAVTRDALYVTHRTQFAAQASRVAESKPMVLRGGTKARDTIEVLAFLTGAATVHISIGSHTYTCQLSVGVHPCTVPLGLGTVRAWATRGGATTAQVTSPFPVTGSPAVQDLQYVAVASAAP